MSLTNFNRCGKNWAKYKVQWINDLIPLAVMGMGRVAIALTLDPNGAMVGLPSQLDILCPMYLTSLRNVCILLIVNNIPYSFSLYKNALMTFICISMSQVYMTQSSIIHSTCDLMSSGSSLKRSFIRAVK